MSSHVPVVRHVQTGMSVLQQAGLIGLPEQVPRLQVHLIPSKGKSLLNSPRKVQAARTILLHLYIWGRSCGKVNF